MRRQRWFEIHDQPWFPGWLRDLVTEALEAVWTRNRTYHPIAARLREAVRRSGAGGIVDLCSGGGGPWVGLYPEVAQGGILEGGALTVTLTDLYPNALLARGSGFEVWPEPVDARHLPAD